jgi:DNA polymerase III sliding clamp (beta) subunit (PCNA family)
MSDLRFEIVYDDRRIEFVSQPVDDYPVIASEDHHSIGVWDKSMVMTMHSLTAFCSNDELRPAMTGIHIEQNGLMSMAATDGHVLKKVRIDGEWKALDAILPKRLLQILPRIVKRKIEVGSSDSYIRLLIDSDIEIMVKPIEAQYPNIDRVIPHEYAHNVGFNRNDMRDLLAEARAFANKDTKSVVIQFSNDQIHLQVDNIEEDITWKSAMPFAGKISDAYKLAVNIDYFDKVLKDIVEDNVVCKLSNPADAMILHGLGVEKETLLLMPIRLQKEDEHEED